VKNELLLFFVFPQISTSSKLRQISQLREPGMKFLIKNRPLNHFFARRLERPVFQD